MSGNLALRRARALLWLGIAFALACGAVWGIYPLPDARQRLLIVPTSGAGFTGRDIALSSTELLILGKADCLHRFYQMGSVQFSATVTDGTKDREAMNDPRQGFLSAGWKIAEEAKVEIPGGEASWIRALDGKREVQALFWFSDGATRFTSTARYWGRTTLRRITLGRYGPEPVLVLLQSVGDRQPDWAELAPEVISKLKL